MAIKPMQRAFLPSIFFLFAFFLMLSVAHAELNAAPETREPPEEFKEFDLYGIDDRSLESETGIVKPGETLSTILRDISVPSSSINYIVNKSKGIFNLKSIKAGNNYEVFVSNVNSAAEFLVYHHNLVDFVVFKLQEPFNVYRGEKRTHIEVVAAGGMINRSLWESIQEAGCDISLVEQLTELYSWAVDFYHLQRGDQFAVVYEREMANDEPVSVKEVAAACFTHRNRDFYLFRYHSEDGVGYYDEQGKGIKKTFLKAPLKYTCITSKFNPGRLHPVLNYKRPHLGTDFAAPEGTPIMSVGDGQVLESKYHRDLGNHIKIRHDKVYCTEYLHLARFADGIKPGIEVKQGQLIGYVGKTGLATGPHLEFRLWKNGKPVDIFKEDLPASKPLDGQEKEKFLHRIASLKSELDRIKTNTEQPIKLTYLKENYPESSTMMRP